MSHTAVVEAIADIMEAHNRGGVVDRALASRIGGEVQVAVAHAVGIGRISSSTQLIGQQAFWNIISQHLASTSSAYTDQEARQNFLHYLRNHADRTSADFATFVAQFRRGGGYPDWGRDGLGGDRGLGGGSLFSHASYDALETDWNPSMPHVLTERNWSTSPFASVAGLDMPTTRSLLAAGFSPQEIVRAGRDVERLAQRSAIMEGLSPRPKTSRARRG